MSNEIFNAVNKICTKHKIEFQELKNFRNDEELEKYFIKLNKQHKLITDTINAIEEGDDYYESDDTNEHFSYSYFFEELAKGNNEYKKLGEYLSMLARQRNTILIRLFKNSLYWYEMIDEMKEQVIKFYDENDIKIDDVDELIAEAYQVACEFNLDEWNGNFHLIQVVDNKINGWLLEDTDRDVFYAYLMRKKNIMDDDSTDMIDKYVNKKYTEYN